MFSANLFLVDRIFFVSSSLAALRMAFYTLPKLRRKLMPAIRSHFPPMLNNLVSGIR